jgi:hypothetical protein
MADGLGKHRHMAQCNREEKQTRFPLATLVARPSIADENRTAPIQMFTFANAPALSPPIF